MHLIVIITCYSCIRVDYNLVHIRAVSIDVDVTAVLLVAMLLVAGALAGSWDSAGSLSDTRQKSMPKNTKPSQVPKNSNMDIESVLKFLQEKLSKRLYKKVKKALKNKN